LSSGEATVGGRRELFYVDAWCALDLQHPAGRPPAGGDRDGPDLERGEMRGHAKGIIAIGDIATGVVALAGVARGGLAIGGLAVGLISLGGLSIGALALGGLAIGASR
jgi:hypothetical protein